MRGEQFLYLALKVSGEGLRPRVMPALEDINACSANPSRFWAAMKHRCSHSLEHFSTTGSPISSCPWAWSGVTGYSAPRAIPTFETSDTQACF